MKLQKSVIRRFCFRKSLVNLFLRKKEYKDNAASLVSEMDLEINAFSHRLQIIHILFIDTTTP